MLPKHIPGLRKLLWKPSHSTRTQEVVAIGDERLPHSSKAAGFPLPPAIHEMISHLDLKRALPVEDGGFR